MTCTSCGDKPKGSSKGFPRAVVEINNPESLVLLRKVVIPVSMGTEEDVPPAIGKYFNVLLQYESNGHIYLYSSDGIPTAIEANIPQEVLDRIDQLEIDVDLLETGLAKETEDREKADGVLQQEIDDIKNSPDVVDIVATYSDLMAYDTSSLGDNDVIRVLRDETHDGQSAYYRWSTSTQTWTFIGTVGDYYTKQQIDGLLDEKQDELAAGENITIADESGSLVISATDTTYTAGYGLELNGTEFSVDPDIVQDTLTAGDNITIEDESGSLVISATDTTYTAGSGLNLTGTTFSVDTSTIATQADLDTKQDVLTAGQNIHITDESGSLVISATGGGGGGLDPNTTFWGQTASNGAVTGRITFGTNGYVNGTNSTVTVYADTAGGADPFEFSHSGFDVADKKITSLANGTASHDAVNKSQLDAKPTITMTSTDPGEGSTLAANNYVAVYGGDPITMDYSTTEINTGAKWIDGSAIYKKTVSTGALPNTNATYTQHNISNMSKIIKAEGYATDGTTFHPLPYANTASNGSVAVQVTSTNIMLSTTSDQSAYTESYVTLYYTKSS